MTPLASRHIAPAALATLLLSACATVPQPAPAAAGPARVEAPADAHRRLLAGSAAVTTASPLASEAGLAMLRAGGNAVDAAVAASFAIGVVEPQMSGLGGSGTMLIWHQADGRAEYLDFYAAQNAASFVGHPPDTRAADLRIVAIPGAVAGVLDAHSKHGRLPLQQVLAPAIALAEDGFPIGQILAQFIRADSAKLHRFPAAAAHMWPDGSPLPPGAVLRNPQLAATLRAVSAHGRAGYYAGDIGIALVAALNAGGHPASAADLAEYTPQWKAPLCAGYRGRIVLSAPPPQTGGQVIQTLKLLEHVPLAEFGLPTHSPRAFDALVSALRVAMADNRGNDDPRWVSVPAGGRISDAFAEARRPLVGTGVAGAAVEAADASSYDATPPEACTHLAPLQAAARPAAPLPAATRDDERQHDEGGETTHISVVDGDGNAVGLTQTNSSTFGSGAFVAGFFLNDSAYRFNDATLESLPATPWRTRTSTIAPTIVLEGGRVRMVTGAPGASRIPTEIAQTMIYVLDYGMDPLDALRMPRIFPAAGSPAVQLEHGFPAELLRDARSMGYDPVAQSSSYARLYMIVRTADGWVAVADPRHDGEPRGF